MRFPALPLLLLSLLGLSVSKVELGAIINDYLQKRPKLCLEGSGKLPGRL